MNTKNPNVYRSELGGYLSKFENRIRESGHFGFLLHTGVSRRILGDLEESQKAKDKKLYGGLMQIESMVNEITANEVSDESQRVIKKIGELKGIVNLVCVILIPLMVVAPMPRRPNSSRIKIEQIETEDEKWS